MVEETATGSWEPEDDLDAEHINPEIPKKLHKSFVWSAIQVAIEVSDTKEEVIRRVKGWNKHNNPLFPEDSLVRMVIWAIKNWDTKFGIS